MEDRAEVCLEEEVERLRRSGMSVAEISQKMGLDEGWVEGLVARAPGEEELDPANGPHHRELRESVRSKNEDRECAP
jgi:hypothetical protein